MNTIKRHRRMIADRWRTPLLEQAIRKTVKPGDVVLDIGCGLGDLTLMALRAGAKKVHACEVDREALKMAVGRIKRAGFEKKVVFSPVLSSEIYLSEKVDVIISETVGSLGFDENILSFARDARKRFLKKGGKIVPKSITLFIAPCEKNPTGKKYSARKIKPTDLLAPAKTMIRFDLQKTRMIGFDQEVTFRAERDGQLTGFAGWIEIEWAKGIRTLTSPFDPPTHWKQGWLPIDKSKKVKKGDKILFRLRIGPKGELFSLASLIEWGYKVKTRSR